MLGCGLQRLSADVYAYSRLGVWLCLLLDSDDCLFPTALHVLEYNTNVLHFLPELVSPQNVGHG